MGEVSIDDVLDEAHWAQFSSSWIGAEQSTFLGAGGGGMQSFGGFAPGLAMFDPVIPVLPEPGKLAKSILEQSLSAPPFPQDSPIDDAEDQDDSPSGQAAYTPDDPSSSSATKSKKTGKIIETKNVHCTKCNQLIARLVLRGTREELDLPCDLLYQCLKCAPQTSVPPSASGTRSGSRKRANELDDTEKFVTCDVCTHVRGHGGLRAKSREHIEFTAEFICLSCSEKYRRCTNCGGTSARGIVGKWRCKELFAGGRKTCSLSHARLGALDMELAVWVIPQELQGAPELPALLECCEETWREHILGKLAVPEVLEHQSEMRSYSDIEKFLLVYEFPGKTLFTTPTKSPNHRRYVSLHWAKTRTRRNKNKPEWALVSHEEKMATQSSSDGWLTYNTKRSNVIRPAGAILCGMWMVEWIVPDKTAVVSTISPFDAVTTDERAPVHLSEIFRRALQELVKHNAEHPNDLWAPPEHIWMLLSKTGVTNRLRVTDGLERRSILPLDEYLTRHIEARPEQFDPHICGLSEHLIQRRPHMKFEVQVRHIGLGTTPEMVEKRAAGRLRRSVKKGR
ncbi:uncharacterized protein STEHIDRAFT_123075 [Stereum hirsutum FP-91666 SS1]|uniref:uncharacterized protein n=1 Tax=Stereum hirsutum (strain FP-91666) TaxID=721885 RepID=UPI000444A570|nr:uncharacterized protein STEHIDRAFT_123075 [Stereum hirsutum FP-91666 SS1]EIM84224.1 hypothetical protein STEHIDRAFT_123075 [Stereum hirsutum FP-91666 SS1]